MPDRDTAQPAMYSSLAGWFHLITAPADYAEEAAFVLGALRDRIGEPVVEALELGCGGGNLASHLKGETRLTLTDISPDMLAVSRSLNPECEHVEGDMRTLRLGRLFDAVVLHDAVMYMTAEVDLRATIETAFLHLRPGGGAIFLPDCVRETFESHTDHGGHDGDGRSLRYLEWVVDPDPTDTTYVTDFAYVLREGGEPSRVVLDRHVMGVFARDDWLRVLHEVGFGVDRLLDPWQRDVFVGVRSPD